MVNALMEAINTDMNLIANRYKRMYRKWYGEAGRLHAKIKHMENSNKEQGRIRAELESHKRWSEKVIGNMNGRIAEDRKDLIEKDKEIARLTARNEYLEKRLAEQEEPTQQHKFKVGDVIRRGGDLRRKVTRLTDSGDYLLCRLGERSLSAPWRAGFVDEQFRLVEQARSTQEEVEEAARAAGNATAERIERDLRELFTGVAIKADEVNTNGDVFTRDAFRGWDLGGPDRSKSHLRGFDGVIHLYGTAYPLSDFCMTELPLHDQPVVNHQVDHDEIVPNYYEFEMYGEEFDVTDVIQATGLSFCLGNVLKYIVRAGRKPGEGALKDLKKAKEYLLREMIEVENSEEG